MGRQEELESLLRPGFMATMAHGSNLPAHGSASIAWDEDGNLMGRLAVYIEAPLLTKKECSSDQFKKVFAERCGSFLTLCKRSLGQL